MNEQILEECVSFFKKNLAYTRMFTELRKKYRKYGKLTGKVCLEQLSEAESKALGAILGKSLLPGDFKFSVSELQKALNETKYCGVEVERLVESYFGERIISNSQRKKEEKVLKELFWDSLLDDIKKELGDDTKGIFWLNVVREQQKYGYYIIMKEREKSDSVIKMILIAVCQAVECLSEIEESGKIRLAMLGAEITRNPHYFDRQNVAGRLLIDALSFLYGIGESQVQEDVLALYYMSGIIPDDISSFTTCYGIHFYDEGGEHEAYRYFIEKGEKYVLTISNLRRLIRAYSCKEKVFIIENQMVFSQICEEIQGKEYSLMCTSGQLKMASLFLIDLLIKSGCKLYYCGDIDPEGIEIADKVIARKPEQIYLWRMTEEEYYNSISDEILTEIRLKKLDKIKNNHLQKLANVVKKEKRAGYQEHLIDLMIKDILAEDEKVICKM